MPSAQLSEPFPPPYLDEASSDGSDQDTPHSAPIPVPTAKPRSRRSTGGRSLLQEIANEEQHRLKAQVPERKPPPHSPRVSFKRESRFSKLRTTLAGLVVSEDAVIDSSVLSPQESRQRREIYAPSTAFCSSPIRIPSPGSTSGRPDSPRSKSYSLEKSLSRRQSRRATSNSSSWTPASAFLSQYNSGSDPTVSGPDDEGREIGHNVKYIIGRQIGYGGFSVIKEAYTIDEFGHKIRRAVKIVRKHVDGKSVHENDLFQLNFEHERSLWKTLSHPYVLSLLDEFEDSFATYCIMHLHPGGTLHDLVRSLRRSSSSLSLSSTSTSRSGSASPKWNRLPVAIVKRYLYQLASALRYLHEDMQIVHRDVKLENCLLSMSSSRKRDEYGDVLLCDFGVAEYIDDASSSSVHYASSSTSADNTSTSTSVSPSTPTSASRTEAAGSLQYASPELLQQEVPNCHLPCVDIWAFGVVCYALLTLKLPFNHDFQPKVQAMILKGECDFDALGEAVRRSVLSEASAIAGQSPIGSTRAEQNPQPQADSNDATSDTTAEEDGEEEEAAELQTSNAIQLVKGCLEMDVNSRWTIRQVLDCEFLRDCAELYDVDRSGY